MSEERIRVGLRIFSEGIELNLGVEEKKESIDGTFVWNHYTECPHCKKKMRIIKWIEKWKAIIF